MICFLAIASGAVYGQHLLITGKVFDELTKDPLPYASVSIAGKSFGTVTNANGEFDFYVHPSLSSDSIVVSHVGYENYRATIQFLANKANAFALKPKPVLLREVVIREQDLTAKEIVAKALKELTVNYATKPYCIEGFFREIEQENGKYVLLSEAAVDVYDQHFDGKRKNHLQEAVNVKEMRRSLRHGEANNRDNIGHALADLFENNDVRYNRGMLDTANNTFTLDHITHYHDRAVYRIGMKHAADSGVLFIDMETFGILKISMERKSRDGAKTFYEERLLKKNAMQRRNWFHFSVEFELYDGKLYPRRMHESEMNELYDAATDQLKITSIETLEYVANHIIPGKESRSAQKLKYGMMIKPGEYHEAFWKNFNTLKLTPLDEKLIRDLEKDISLQKQYAQQR